MKSISYHTSIVLYTTALTGWQIMLYEVDIREWSIFTGLRGRTDSSFCGRKKSHDQKKAWPCLKFDPKIEYSKPIKVKKVMIPYMFCPIPHPGKYWHLSQSQRTYQRDKVYTIYRLSDKVIRENLLKHNICPHDQALKIRND